jgi:hypothetical protein
MCCNARLHIIGKAVVAARSAQGAQVGLCINSSPGITTSAGKGDVVTRPLRAAGFFDVLKKGSAL